MKSSWESAFDNLGKCFPLTANAPDLPSLASALDEGVKDLLLGSALHPSVANPLFVEDLLRDCVARITNCLVLREKAQEIEVRAVSTALQYKTSMANLLAQDAIQKALAGVGANQCEHALGATVKGGKLEFLGDKASFDATQAENSKLIEELKAATEVLKLKSQAPGNGSNYVERFAFLKKLFDLSLVEAFRRANVCQKALKEIYGIAAELPPIRPVGYLDDLAQWAQTASNALDDALDGRQYGDIYFALAAADESAKFPEVLPLSQYKSAIATGRLTFSLTSSYFETLGMKEPLLRSLRLQARGKDATLRLWSCAIDLPQGPLSQAVPTFPCTAITDYVETPESDSIVSGVHNLSPVGKWEIRVLGRNSLGAAVSADEIPNLFLFLRVSYKRL